MKLKVETYKVKGWVKDEVGLVVAENKDWILTQYIPVDYVIDGYRLYRKKYIQKRTHGAKEKSVERVLKLRKIKVQKPKKFSFDTPENVLRWSEKKYGLFEFQDMFDDQLFYGKINRIKEGKLKIDMIKANGKIKKGFKMQFPLNKIRAISFETDYFESMRLLMKDSL